MVAVEKVKEGQGVGERTKKIRGSLAGAVPSNGASSSLAVVRRVMILQLSSLRLYFSVEAGKRVGPESSSILCHRNQKLNCFKH